MHIALNGYFWDQPHTGSGQYTRHLWRALSTLVSQLPDKDAHLLSLLLPGTGNRESVSRFPVPCSLFPVPDSQSSRPQSKIQSLPSNEVKGPRSKIGKLFWEQWS